MEKLSAMVRKLAAGGIEFVLVGGYAAVAHGSSLMTRDLDVCCPFSLENLMRLQRVLADVHPVHRMTPQKIPLELTPELCSRLKNLYLQTDLCVLDCLSEVQGVGKYDQVLSQSLEVELPDSRCRVLNLDALIASKESMKRARDLLTVRQLRAIKERAH